MKLRWYFLQAELSSKGHFPKEVLMIPVLSTLNSTRSFFFISSTVFFEIEGYGSGFRAGHQSFGAKQFSQFPHMTHHIRGSHKSIKFEPVFCPDLLNHLFAARKKSAPASSASFCFSPLAITSTRTFCRYHEAEQLFPDHLIRIFWIHTQTEWRHPWIRRNLPCFKSL